MAKEGKKVVDLIYIEKQKDEETMVKDYRFSLEHWKTALKKLQEHYFEQHFNSTSPDVLEILAMRKFLGQFVQGRIDWIINEVSDAGLRRKYLNVLPPFPQKGGIKRILLHFFQMIDSSDKKNLLYKAKNDIEKEISILWDIYKLRKTIDSIETIKKSLGRSEAFPSIYSVEKRNECLDSLKVVFQLMFQMSIQKEYQKDLYVDLSADLMQPENVLERQENGQSFVYPHVISKFDYRNHFFYVYYCPGMKAKIAGKIKNFHFNYLDFEVIKQEFLVDWMNSKLKGNSKKREIYKRYCIGNKTIDQIVDENPASEIEILKQLPLAVFNDITAEVNEAVSEDLKSDVDSFSENHGEYAKVNKEFEKAQTIAKSPISKIKQMLTGKKENPQPETKAVEASPKPVEAPLPEPEKPQYTVIKVKKNQIDYPYFQKEAATYKSKMSLMRVKMGPAYTEFNKDLGDFFGSVTESALIKRRTPKHEVIFPHIIKETVNDKVVNHLLILGAEVKAKQLSMAYSTASSEGTHSYTCFFLYGTDVVNKQLGEIVETRHARGIDFSLYNFAFPEVQKAAMEFYKMVMKK